MIPHLPIIRNSQFTAFHNFFGNYGDKTANPSKGFRFSKLWKTLGGFVIMGTSYNAGFNP